MSLENEITIVALIALEEEFSIFQDTFRFKADHSVANRMCLEHEVNVPHVRLISVLAQNMGANNARSSASYAIENFAPDMVVVIGIAGGISSDFSIGDVCISNEVIDVLNNAKIEEVNGKDEIKFSPDIYPIQAELSTSFTFTRTHPNFKGLYSNWQQMAQQRVKDFGLEDVCKKLPVIGVGPIVCGPVSGSTPYNKKIKGIDRKISAIETESGGVFQELSSRGIPGIAIRGISDLADADKNELEDKTEGKARELAMRNASEMLATQLHNHWFLEVAKKYANSKSEGSQVELFPEKEFVINPVAIIETEIKENLEDLCPEFRNKPEGFYLPIPRISRKSYSEDIETHNLEQPENIVEVLTANDRVVVKLARSYPNQALSWTLAQNLLREEIDGKIVLPFVVKGVNIKPPKSGLLKCIPQDLVGKIEKEHFIPIFIIEEPDFSSRSKIKFLTQEISKTNGKILVLSKSEDYATVVDQFITDNDAFEYELTPISFSETAQFLEKAFDMPAYEAEAVAIKLEDTFRKFQLDAHPTYFASLQEETLAALINANKRAELIQLAVDGLLSLIVAADKSSDRLSRTTRERFLKLVVLQMAQKENFDDEDLSCLASSFLKEYKFNVSQTEFLNPFFQAGLLFQSDGKIFFTHPYVRSYLLAAAFKEIPEKAKGYFDPNGELFDFYAYDLYCEMGPSLDVIGNISEYINTALENANDIYSDQNVFTETKRPMTSISSVPQIKGFALRLASNAEKMNASQSSSNCNDNVRVEKQRLLDIRRQARAKLTKEKPSRKTDDLPEELQIEFNILDGLSRSLALSVISVGSGAESLDGDSKTSLSNLVLKVADRFTDIWTRNRLRIDFDKSREEILSDENIWELMEKIGAEDEAYETIKADLSFFLSETEIQMILEPLRRVMWRISASASAKVLSPVIKETVAENSIQKLILGCWYLDINPEAGKSLLKAALKDYKGSTILRLAIATHCLNRLYWHHYKTAGADHFIASAKRAISPLGLKPSNEKIEEAKKGIK